MKTLYLIRKIVFKIKRFLYENDKLAHLYHTYYGVNFGKNIRFTAKDTSFGGEPFLIEIGNNVTITQGVKFQTHDGGTGVLRKKYPGLNIFGKIKISDNVFIGEDVMIMYGVTIGNNVVIGARSVITKDIPDNVVVCGTPAKVIRSIEEYEAKCLDKGIYIFEKDYRKRELEIKKKIREKALLITKEN